MKSFTTIRTRSAIALVALITVLPVCVASAEPATAPGSIHENPGVASTAASRAECGPGSMPETGLQGDVPAEDRNSGRSRDGYSCNMSQIGGYSGRGGGITSTNFEHCFVRRQFLPREPPGPRTGRPSSRRIGSCQSRSHRHADRTRDAGRNVGEPQGQHRAKAAGGHGRSALDRRRPDVGLRHLRLRAPETTQPRTRNRSGDAAAHHQSRGRIFTGTGTPTGLPAPLPAW